MMYGNEGQHLVQCPYDPKHIIRGFRFPYHISKCRKNHPNVKLKNCSYNFSHMIRSEDFREHMEICPNKYIIESGSISAEHETCKNRYVDDGDDNFDVETDDGNHNFRLIQPLKKTSEIPKNEKSNCIGLYKKYNDTFSVRESELDLEDNGMLDEDDELPPLQLPKTKSKAFKIKNIDS